MIEISGYIRTGGNYIKSTVTIREINVEISTYIIIPVTFCLTDEIGFTITVIVSGNDIYAWIKPQIILIGISRYIIRTGGNYIKSTISIREINVESILSIIIIAIFFLTDEIGFTITIKVSGNDICSSIKLKILLIDISGRSYGVKSTISIRQPDAKSPSFIIIPPTFFLTNKVCFTIAVVISHNEIDTRITQKVGLVIITSTTSGTTRWVNGIKSTITIG